MPRIIATFFLMGLLFGAGPCLASCGPFLIAYIAGTKKNTYRGLITYAVFSLARISVYILLGLGVFFFSQLVIEQLLGRFSGYIFLLAGGLMVILGLFMAAGRKIRLPFWQHFYSKISEHDTKGIFILGIIIGLLPCVPLLAVLSYIGMISRSWSSNLIYVLSFGAGTFLSPLVLAAIIAGFIPRFLSGKRPVYYSLFSLLCGVVVIILGVRLIAKAF